MNLDQPRPIIVPIIKGEAALRFEKQLLSSGKCKPRRIPKKKETAIIDFINQVIENEKKSNQE